MQKIIRNFLEIKSLSKLKYKGSPSNDYHVEKLLNQD